jgi:hypothetical protein
VTIKRFEPRLNVDRDLPRKLKAAREMLTVMNVTISPAAALNFWYAAPNLDLSRVYRQRLPVRTAIIQLFSCNAVRSGTG